MTCSTLIRGKEKNILNKFPKHGISFVYGLHPLLAGLDIFTAMRVKCILKRNDWNAFC